MTVIGDSQVQQEDMVAVSMPQSLITEAELLDVDSYVNDTNKSGKKAGGTYYVAFDTDVVDIVMATGSATDDPWIRLGAASEVPAITLTVAGDVGDAAGITAQLNIIEGAINDLATASTITPV